jgi:5'-methylthioadenosine phosphorylase
LDKLIQEEHSEMVLGKHWEGQTTGMIKFMTKKEGRGAEGSKNVEFLFPGVWD